MFPLFFISFLLPGLIFADRQITLTNDSTSYVAYGTKLLNYQTLTVSTDCGSCSILLEFQISDLNNTFFSFTSPTQNYTYDQVTSSQFFILSGPVSLLTSPGANQTQPTFIASFRRWIGTIEPDWLASNFRVIPDQNGFIDTARLENNIRSMTLVMGRASYPNVKIFAPQVSTGCSLYLLAGNLPSYETREKMKIYEFTNATIPLYQNSFVRTSAFTILVPENCTGSIMYSVLDKATLIADAYKPSNGFSMSYEWVEPFGETEMLNEQMTHTGWADGDASPFFPISFTVKSINPGPSGFTTFQTTNYSDYPISAYNVSTPITEYALPDMSGQKFKIIWNPSQNSTKKGYLIWYSIGNGTVMNTSTTIGATSAGSSMAPTTTTTVTTVSPTTQTTQTVVSNASSNTTLATNATTTSKMTPTSGSTANTTSIATISSTATATTVSTTSKFGYRINSGYLALMAILFKYF